MSEAARHHECKGVVLCRRCAAAYFGKSPDWFDDHVRDEIPAVVVEGRASGWRREHLDTWLKLHTEGAWADDLPPLGDAEGQGGWNGAWRGSSDTIWTRFAGGLRVERLRGPGGAMREAKGRKPRERSIPRRVEMALNTAEREVLRKVMRALAPLSREEKIEALRLAARHFKAAKA